MDNNLPKPIVIINNIKNKINDKLINFEIRRLSKQNVIIRPLKKIYRKLKSKL